jgi:NTE family protein
MSTFGPRASAGRLWSISNGTSGPVRATDNSLSGARAMPVLGRDENDEHDERATRCSVMRKMGLVLQGGGALGAYEYGAVTRLVELGWHPVAVTGVSIGAATTAAVAGARDGDICKSLKLLWEAITLDPVPFWPLERQATFSIFGNPRFWRMRHDVLGYRDWTSLYDVSPMRRTLAEVCDFEQLNNPSHMRVAVTATNVKTGDQVSFANFVANLDSVHYVTPRISRVTLTPDHILASGSLPPGFPMTVIDGVPYWDGGLFDNTPIEPLLDLLTEDELENLPIFIVNLFATHSNPPANLREVQERMLEISFESRFLLAHADADGSAEFTRTVEEILRDLPADSPARQRESFRRLVRFRALKNMRVIEAEHAPMTGGMDFSAHGVRTRYQSGYSAVNNFLARSPDLKPSLR